MCGRTPTSRSSRRFSVRVRRPAGSPRERLASRAAIRIATAARMPGTIERTIACRTPTTATRIDAANGPMIAPPALSPARSTPNARPYESSRESEVSSMSRAGERTPS